MVDQARTALVRVNGNHPPFCLLEIQVCIRGRVVPQMFVTVVADPLVQFIVITQQDNLVLRDGPLAPLTKKVEQRVQLAARVLQRRASDNYAVFCVHLCQAVVDLGLLPLDHMSLIEHNALESDTIDRPQRHVIRIHRVDFPVSLPSCLELGVGRQPDHLVSVLHCSRISIRQIL